MLQIWHLSSYKEILICKRLGQQTQYYYYRYYARIIFSNITYFVARSLTFSHFSGFSFFLVLPPNRKFAGGIKKNSRQEEKVTQRVVI